MKTNAQAGSFHEKMEREGTKSDLRLSATECFGTVEISGKGSFEVIRKGNDVWAKPDSTFAEGMNSALGKTAFSTDKWTHGTPSNALMAKLASWCHQEQFTAPDTLDAGSKVTKGKVTTVDGQSAVPVVLSGKGESVTWYVATTGKPYFIKQDSTREDMQDLTDSDFGTAVGAEGALRDGRGGAGRLIRKRGVTARRASARRAVRIRVRRLLLASHGAVNGGTRKGRSGMFGLLDWHVLAYAPDARPGRSGHLTSYGCNATRGRVSEPGMPTTFTTGMGQGMSTPFDAPQHSGSTHTRLNSVPAEGGGGGGGGGGTNVDTQRLDEAANALVELRGDTENVDNGADDDCLSASRG